MAYITVENLTFAYPGAKKNALCRLSFSVERGEIVLLCGPTGCGKTTLLRQLKKSIAPAGTLTGSIFIDGKAWDGFTLREEAKTAGFVFQNPEHQTVTKKVWRELAFGMENLGIEPRIMRRRMAEMSDYFGLTGLLHRDIDSLSGGQKQILNLASVMCMQPSILLLDEPTAMLDPVMAETFLSMISRINRDFGTTVILSEHRLEAVMPLATRMLVLDQGNLVFDGRPDKAASIGEDAPFFRSLPYLTRLYNRYGDGHGGCPLDVAKGRRWLEKTGLREKLKAGAAETEAETPGTTGNEASGSGTVGDNIQISGEAGNMKERSGTTGDGAKRCKAAGGGKIFSVAAGYEADDSYAITVKNLWFRYEKNGSDILKDLSLRVRKGEIFGIAGGNGAGKSTLLAVLRGIKKPWRGRLKQNGTAAMMPQDVFCLFSKDTVLKEAEAKKYPGRAEKILQYLRLDALCDTHPYDLSAGQQQLLGIAKMLISDPDILLFDEPVKGLDGAMKENVGNIFKNLRDNGKTVVIVSHDMEFLAEYTDRCGLLFDGSFAAVENTRDFLRGNSYYTIQKYQLLD